MKNFKYERAENFDQASSLLKESKSVLIAGGTDLVGVLKERILDDYPETVIDIKRIPGSSDIKVEGGELKIGALTKLKDIVESDDVKRFAPALAEAAKSVATPLIRNTATIGGNLCQDVRCWFYRYPHEAGGRLVCSRKGGDKCYALQGDNRYHSIYGGMKAHCTPCTGNCPAGTDIPAYMEELRKGNVDKAAEIIMKVNPMPMLTSRVCAHTCQDGCNRGCNDESVAISHVERSVGDYILDHADKFYTAPETENGKTVAIIGSGPSGLAAAYYLRKAGAKVTVYEKMSEPGGMLRYAIPHYRLPKTYVNQLVNAFEKMGIKFICNTTIGEDIDPIQLEKEFDTVYYATGAWKRPFLGLDGEELTVFGLDFLVQVNKWMLDKAGSHVLVTGGGNVAMDVAITAKRLGAKSVTLACLESEKEMPASKEEIARAREEGITIMPSWGLLKVVSEDKKVTGMELKRCTSVKDESGRFNPQYDENEKTIVYADSILMAVGQKVDLSFLGDKYELALQRGLIEVEDETQSTSRQGVYAGGDATSGPATVVKAVSAGRKASVGMLNYLEIKENGCCGKKGKEEKFLKFDANGTKILEAHKLTERPMAERDIKLEDSQSLTLDEAVDEAARCMNCGCYAVNPSDIAPVLVALDGVVKTNLREISASDFCTEQLKTTEVLGKGEIVEEVRIPLVEGAKMKYDKFRLRDSVDFAIVSLASMYATEKGKISGAKLVLGGVAPVPVRATAVEGYLIGKKADSKLAEEAAELAVKDVVIMERNGYKVEEVKALVKNSILQLID